MRALVVETGRKLVPFGDPPGEACFAAGTVFGAMRESLARRGIEVSTLPLGERPPQEGGPYVVLADHTYASDKCLGDFLSLALGSEAPCRLALARTPSSDYVRPVSSVSVEPLDERELPRRKGGKLDRAAKERIAYDAFFVPKGQLPDADDGQSLLAALRERAHRLLVPKREIVRDIRMPIVGDGADVRLKFPITSTVAAHVEHWVHVLWLNHLAFGIRWMELCRAHKLWALSRLALALPPTLPRLLSRFVWKGRGVRIHPTAHVEASILGDGVVIGARASVRNSILGEGVEVGDHATVLASTLGPGAFVTPKTFFVWSTAYERAVVSNYKLQMSVLGKGASTSTWAGLLDAKFQGAIEVPHDGALASTERSFLGSCIGHGAHLGAKVLLMPGRAVPNETFIAMRPDELIREVPDGIVPGVPYVRHEGTLVPLERLLKARAPKAEPKERARALPQSPTKT